MGLINSAPLFEIKKMGMLDLQIFSAITVVATIWIALVLLGPKLRICLGGQ